MPLAKNPIYSIDFYRAYSLFPGLWAGGLPYMDRTGAGGSGGPEDHSGREERPWPGLALPWMLVGGYQFTKAQD